MDEPPLAEIPNMTARVNYNISALSTFTPSGSPVKGNPLESGRKTTYQTSRAEPMRSLISANGSLRSPTMATRYLHGQKPADGKMRTLEGFYDGPIKTFEVRTGRSQGFSSLVTSGAAEKAQF